MGFGTHTHTHVNCGYIDVAGGCACVNVCIAQIVYILHAYIVVV